MQVWRTPGDIDPALAGSVLTIGIFDGVHRGHHDILTETVRQAREGGLASIVLTFDPHPVTVHNPSLNSTLIMSLEDRLTRIEALGVEATYVQHYTLDYSSASARQFIEDQVVGELKAKAIVVGEDVRFGHRNTGDAQLLIDLGAEFGFDVTLMADQGDEGRRWSSTWIRELLAEGNVEKVHDILGRHHRLRGTVVHGFKRGRELGFPTANLEAKTAGAVPADGVYAGWMIRKVGSAGAVEHLPAAISIGTNPQFDGKVRTVEAHVLGRSDLDLYGEEIAIDLVTYLRPMVSFDSLDGLLEQMDEDLRMSAEALGVPVAGRVDPDSVTAGS